MIVLDASSAVAMVLDDEDAPTELLGTDLVGALAPTIWPYEVLSALRAAEKRGRIDHSTSDEASSLLAKIPLEFVHPAFESVLAVARATGLSVYDASYLTLALAHDIPLYTRDRKLADAATAVGVEVRP